MVIQDSKPKDIINLFKEKRFKDPHTFYLAVYVNDILTVKLFLNLFVELKASNNIDRIIALNIISNKKSTEIIKLLQAADEQNENRLQIKQFIKIIQCLLEVAKKSNLNNHCKISLLLEVQSQALYHQSVKKFLENKNIN